jgi:hypothetical protein
MYPNLDFCFENIPSGNPDETRVLPRRVSRRFCAFSDFSFPPKKEGENKLFFLPIIDWVHRSG